MNDDEDNILQFSKIINVISVLEISCILQYISFDDPSNVVILKVFNVENNSSLSIYCVTVLAITIYGLFNW